MVACVILHDNFTIKFITHKSKKEILPCTKNEMDNFDLTYRCKLHVYIFLEDVNI
jgi:hypothetical protein